MSGSRKIPPDRIGNSLKTIAVAVLIFLGALPASSEAGVKIPAQSLKPSEEAENYLPIFHRWSGDYAIDQLDRLKGGHVLAQGGYIGEEGAFLAFWTSFKRDTAPPKIDFTKYVVVVVIGDPAYQRLFIAKVTLKDNVAVVTAAGNTFGSRPTNSVPLALAVIPREHVKFVQVGEGKIAVE